MCYTLILVSYEIIMILLALKLSYIIITCLYWSRNNSIKSLLTIEVDSITRHERNLTVALRMTLNLKSPNALVTSCVNFRFPAAVQIRLVYSQYLRMTTCISSFL